MPPSVAAPPATLPPTQDLNDWELVRLAQRGGDPGRDAFQVLYERYVTVVYRYCVARVTKRVIAEDLTGETFLRALQKIRTISDRGQAFPAWLVTIAGNLIRDRWKSSEFRLCQPTGEFFSDEQPLTRDAAPNGASDPAVIATNSALAAILVPLVQQLSPAQRECVRLRFYAGLSVAATADVMGRNGPAVKALQHRAVRALAEALQGIPREELTHA